MKFAVKTEIGKRAHNEDSYLLPRSETLPLLFAVADGMGGHAAGAVASGMVVEKLGESLSSGFQEREIEQLIGAIQHANLAVFEAAEKDPSLDGMGTTLVCALVLGHSYLAANVGDSRLYYFDGKTLERVTTDHSLVEQLVLAGVITREAAKHHPHRNIITRGVGLSPVVDVDVFEREWNAGDLLLLCSDGMHGQLEDDAMTAILSSERSLEEMCDELVRAALDGGSTDNITLILIRCEEGDLL
ncbi:MAG: Stp1/IreP family PP2C-type Ser/Thr phosphatase [Eubacteriales bacterium]|nr:Stp1/IreP family PP2C-type Ser/Thr phosphatase [Eubacteriales bacterium]